MIQEMFENDQKLVFENHPPPFFGKGASQISNPGWEFFHISVFWVPRGAGAPLSPEEDLGVVSDAAAQLAI